MHSDFKAEESKTPAWTTPVKPERKSVQPQSLYSVSPKKAVFFKRIFTRSFLFFLTRQEKNNLKSSCKESLAPLCVSQAAAQRAAKGHLVKNEPTTRLLALSSTSSISSSPPPPPVCRGKFFLLTDQAPTSALPQLNAIGGVLCEKKENWQRGGERD